MNTLTQWMWLYIKNLAASDITEELAEKFYEEYQKQIKNGKTVAICYPRYHGKTYCDKLWKTMLNKAHGKTKPLSKKTLE
jgi:cytosine/adenosine deaminase-related metal-dependent hydrolase